MKLEVKDVTCGYGKKIILKDINLVFEKNNVYGLMGLNGAGKTTLLKTIFNELTPKKGQIIYNNNPISINDYRNMFFFLANNDLPNDYIIKEYFARMSNYAHQDFKKFNHDIKHLLSLFLPTIDYKKRTIDSLSSGQKKMVSLILCLALKPKIIFFDEPTANLDISNKDELIKNIIRLKDQDTILVLVSHLIDELAPYLNTMIIIQQGKIVFNDDVSNKDKRDMKNLFLKYTVGKVKEGNFDKYGTNKNK